MQTASRRVVLQGGGAIAAAALVIAAPNAACASEERLMDLWRRYVEAEGVFSKAVAAEDEAESYGKGGLRRLRRASEVAHAGVLEIRREIILMQDVTPLAIAIKLAMTFQMEPNDFRDAPRVPLRDHPQWGILDVYDDCTLRSLYEDAVKACGFDPRPVWRKAVA